ncbi:MAG TPA: 2-phospho-L-lactate transferase [Ktedonobacterales bacterium]|nr:2-phospho-L-lactate transferase [Ktedonobacterales bacterium]
MIVALAGGVGGAKLAHGLALAATGSGSGAQPRVIVNTADDFEHHGLRISPDLDTVLYTLAGLANAETGWGLAGDTFTTLDMLARYGVETWFQLGDRDFATHLLRTQRLRAGWTLTQVTAAFTRALGVEADLLPMCDEPIATMVETPDGALDFQDYFVRRRQTDDVRGVQFTGIEQAHIPEGVRAACAAADLIVFCPSNPIVSIGPILAVPGMRALLQQVAAPRIAVSPIVGGRALKGPADRMLAGLGHAVSATGVARLYQGLIDGMVIDQVDAELAASIEALGMRVLVTDTMMRNERDRQRLAREVMAFGAPGIS